MEDKPASVGARPENAGWKPFLGQSPVCFQIEIVDLNRRVYLFGKKKIAGFSIFL